MHMNTDTAYEYGHFLAESQFCSKMALVGGRLDILRKKLDVVVGDPQGQLLV